MRAVSGTRIAIALLALAFFAILSPPRVQAEPPMKSGEILIKFKPGTSTSIRDAILSDLGANRIRSFDRIHAEQDRLTGRTVADAISRYRGHPAVEFIEPNYMVSTLSVPNDPEFSGLWGLRNVGQTGGTPGADIHATQAWDVSTGSSDVVVAIIDTGVDYTHPDLAANIFINTAEIPGNGVDDDGNGFIDDVRGWDFINHDNNPMDDAGHGTHVAGTIGAVGNNGLGVVGVNWSVRLMPLKFLSSGGSGSTADAISAIEYATMMGVDIMSNSWGGGGFSEALRQSIQNAMDAGIVFVAAAGNSGSNNDVTPTYPASYDLANIVAVAATNPFDVLASFSSYGPTTVDLAAPGTDILSTIPGGGYGLLSGTSMATPHVSGVLALIKARFPLASFSALKSKLLASVDVLPSLAGFVASGGRANAFRAIADPDTIPPSAITTLQILETTSNTIRLSWTATGDDLGSGTAGGYEVRSAPFPLTDGNFGTGALAPNAPSPQPAGSLETMEVPDLAFSTLYYIAIRVRDDVGNPSSVSNVVSATTLGPPTLALNPTSIAVSLLTGASVNQPVVLSNVGAGTLDFRITEERSDAVVTAHDYVPIVRGSADPRVGEPVVTGSGGPDLFGYRWSDSDQPGGPVFDWVEISGVGTQIPMSQLDDNFGPIPIGFPFSFYGRDFTQLRTCTHGWISFTNASTQFSNQPLPNAGAPENLIAAFWEDLNFGGIRRAYYYNDGNRLIIEYKDVPATAGGGPYTFETILNPNGTIVFQYLSMGSPTNGATVGVQNATRNDGLNIAFNTPYVRSGLAVRISRVPEWFHVTPVAGRVPASASTTLDVAVNATDLTGGTYTGAVHIHSNDPAQPETVLPLQLIVTGVPDIDVSRASVDFGSLFVGGTRSDTVLVANRGTQLLHVSSIETTTPFAAAPPALDLPPSERGRVVVTFHPGNAAPFLGELVLRSDDPDEAEVRIPLSGVGLVAPDIEVSPASFSASLPSGESTTRTLHVANTGGSNLPFQVLLENFAFPQPSPAATAPTRSAPEILAHYDESRSDSLAAAPSPAQPFPQPGVIPLWKQFQAALAESVIIFSDDMEGGPKGWTHYATLPGGGDNWALGAGRHHSGGNSWHVSQHAGVGAEALQSPPISLIGYNSALLAFHHWYNFDDCGDPFFEPDGGIVEISTDGGATWVQVRPLTGYPYVLDDICGNPLAFHEAYSHDGGVGNEFVPALFDLTPFLGSTVRIRFQAGWDCGNCALNEGWFIDDVMVYSHASRIVDVNPSSGDIPAGSSLDLDMGIHTLGLIGGDYSWDLVVLSNDPDEGRIAVPTALHVIGVPDILLSPSSIDFGVVFAGVARTETLVVYNAGTDILHVSQVASDQASISVIGATSFQLAPGVGRGVALRFAPTGAGPVSGTIRVTSDDPDQPTAEMSVGGVGLIPPVITVAPASIHEDLITNETRTRVLTVGNTGGSDLEFSLEVGAGASITVSSLPPLGKGEVDSRVGPLVTQGFGGPDHFGYRWSDSDQPGGPVFQWVDIRSTGTVIPISGDDQTSAPIPIGFPFRYYDTAFSTFRACTNGFLSFTSSSAAYSNLPLPSFGAPENILAAFWDDLFVSTDSRVFYRNDGARLILEFDNVYHLGSGGPYTFEILLYPNGSILYQYLSMSDPLTNATVGFQNGAQNDGLTVVYNQSYVHGGLAVRISAAPNWLSLSPTQGTVPPAGTRPINATLNATGLFSGDYAAAIAISSNDPFTPVRSVPVSIHIVGVPDLAATPASLDFGALYLGRSVTRTLQVTNVGTDRLVVSGMTAGFPDYTMSPTAFTLEPLQSGVVNVTFTANTPGDRTTQLHIASNDPDSPAAVDLIARAVIPPDIAVSPASLSADLYSSETSRQRLTVRNNAGDNLEVSLSVRSAEPDSASGSPVSVPSALRAPTRNTTNPYVGAPAAQSEYDGANLHFGITPYGEIMPFQFPHGFEHLRVGSFIAGYTVSYLVLGVPRTWIASYESRIGIVPVSYSELENSPGRLVVEVVTQTQDGLLLIRRRFTFPRGEKYIRIDTSLEAQGALSGLIFKEYADWDMDGDFTDDNWDYDRQRNMVYASDEHYAAIASTTTPTYMDIFGWNDYASRGTTVDIPSGPVQFFDGLEVLHFDLGPLNSTQSARVTTAYGAGDDLADLRRVMDEALQVVTWLTVDPVEVVIPAGGAADIDATFAAGILASGTYNARIELDSNDPDNPQVFVPASMHVTAVPILALEPVRLDFGASFVGQPYSRTLMARNTGAQRLEVTSVSVTLSDYTVGPVAFGLDPGESTAVVVGFIPAAVGERNATLNFSSNGRNPSTQVPLTGTGVIPPILALRPSSIEAAAIPGTAVTKSFLLCNDGGAALTFDMASPVGLGVPPPRQPYLDRAKEAPDPRPGQLGSGGPDAYGHMWLDSDDVGGPVFEWVDITTTGTHVPFDSFVDDGTLGPLPIGFEFPYFGTGFHEFNVCTNGFISFTSHSTLFLNQPLPNDGPNVPENLIAPLWRDFLYVEEVGSSVYYKNDGTRLIIQFNNMIPVGSFLDLYSFQIILKPDGEILYQYLTLGSPPTSGTVGIQNAARDDGLNIAFNANYPHANQAIRIGRPVNWITVSPTSGLVAPGECATVSVHLDSADLSIGDHTTAVQVSCNDPVHPQAAAGVLFHVGLTNATLTDLDPNTLNLESNGRFITVHTELPASLDPARVLLPTVRFQGTIAPAQSSLSIGDFNGNGTPDLSFKFDRASVEAILPEGDDVPVLMTGEVENTTFFAARDMIRVIRPHLVTPNGGEILFAGSIRVVTWTNPVGWRPDFAALYYSPDRDSSWVLIDAHIIGTSYIWTVPSTVSPSVRTRVYLYDGRGVMGYDSSDQPFTITTTTGVEVAESSLPKVHALFQNVPNPFNPVTLIRFELPAASRTVLEVFAVDGRRVRTLMDQPLAAGRYRVLWDGRNDGRRPVASGVYLYRIRAGAYMSSKRMLLVK